MDQWAACLDLLFVSSNYVNWLSSKDLVTFSTSLSSIILPVQTWRWGSWTQLEWCVWSKNFLFKWTTDGPCRGQSKLLQATHSNLYIYKCTIVWHTFSCFQFHSDQVSWFSSLHCSWNCTFIICDCSSIVWNYTSCIYISVYFHHVTVL